MSQSLGSSLLHVAHVCFFAEIPTILQLFDLFWPCTLLRKIVIESN